uniref:F5/8 type C domain-containing protein n=1 Tax=Ciona savignyi TaxID=51511 RepID=H2ZPV6_CIOSA
MTARRLTTTNRPAPTTLHNNKSILLLTIRPAVSRYYESTFTPTRTSLTTHDYNRRTDNARISLTTENAGLRSTINLVTVPQATREPENINNPTTKPFVTIPNTTTEGQRTANEYFTKRQQTTLIPITEYFRKQQSSKRPEEPHQATNRTTTFSPIVESTTLYSIAESTEPREIMHTTKEPTSVFPTTIFPSTFKLPDCQQSIGIESGEIFDSSFSASSHYPSYPAARARINDGYGWRPNYDDLEQYLEIDLGDDITLTSIATQGYYYFFTSNYVTKFMVEYENSRTKGFVMYQDLNGEDKIFKANDDGNEIVTNQFSNQPFVVRRLRILPTEWYNNINLKVELYRPCVDDN